MTNVKKEEGKEKRKENEQKKVMIENGTMNKQRQGIDMEEGKGDGEEGWRNRRRRENEKQKK